MVKVKIKLTTVNGVNLTFENARITQLDKACLEMFDKQVEIARRCILAADKIVEDNNENDSNQQPI